MVYSKLITNVQHVTCASSLPDDYILCAVQMMDHVHASVHLQDAYFTAFHVFLDNVHKLYFKTVDFDQ